MFYSEINYDGVVFSSTFTRNDKNLQIDAYQKNVAQGHTAAGLKISQRRVAE